MRDKNIGKLIFKIIIIVPLQSYFTDKFLILYNAWNVKVFDLNLKLVFVMNYLFLNLNVLYMIVYNYTVKNKNYITKKN